MYDVQLNIRTYRSIEVISIDTCMLRIGRCPNNCGLVKSEPIFDLVSAIDFNMDQDPSLKFCHVVKGQRSKILTLS